jgi:hypothetical protein
MNYVESVRPVLHSHLEFVQGLYLSKEVLQGSSVFYPQICLYSVQFHSG